MRRLAMALLLTWLALGFAHNTTRAWAGWSRRQVDPAPEAWGWRFGMRPPRRLARCAHFAAATLPPGSRVLFSSGSGSVEEWRWAAFLLHRYDLAYAGPFAAAAAPRYLVTFDREPPTAGERVAARGTCAVYRLP